MNLNVLNCVQLVTIQEFYSQFNVKIASGMNIETNACFIFYDDFAVVI